MRRVIWGVVISLLAISLVFTFQSDNIKTNLFALLPAESSLAIPHKTIDQYSEKLSRKVIFLVSSSDEDKMLEKSDMLNQHLLASGIFSEIRYKLSDAELHAMYQTFEPYQFGMLTQTASNALQANPEKWLSEKLVSQLVSPVAGMDSRSLTADPFGLYRDFLVSLPTGNQAAQIKNGFTLFKGKNQTHLLISAELSDSAFSQDIQDAFSQLLTTISAHDNSGPTITVFGVIRYALENRVLAQQEMSTIGLGSLLGIVFIFYFVFRRFLLLNCNRGATIVMSRYGC